MRKHRGAEEGERRGGGRGQGWGGGDDADMRREGREEGRISERYSSCLHSLPPFLPSSFIHSFNLVSARCRVTDDMDGRTGGRQPSKTLGQCKGGVAPITCEGHRIARPCIEVGTGDGAAGAGGVKRGAK